GNDEARTQLHALYERATAALEPIEALEARLADWTQRLTRRQDALEAAIEDKIGEDRLESMQAMVAQAVAAMPDKDALAALAQEVQAKADASRVGALETSVREDLKRELQTFVRREELDQTIQERIAGF